MPPKPRNWALIGKMTAAGLICCVGGPALVYYVTPSEEELFLKYNPDLQKRSLENRIGKQQDFDDFVTKLKEYSKSDKTIWAAADDAARVSKENKFNEQTKLLDEIQARKDLMRKDGIPSVPGGNL